MPQVPYNPVPEAVPASGGTPTKQLSNKQAFGQNIAGGLERVADGMTRMAQGADAHARGMEKLAAGMGDDAVGLEKIAKGHEKVAAGQAAFGKALDGAGTEIFGRAVALQNLVNDADAREATTQYMMKVSDLHADFNSKQGKAAADALPKYKEDLVNLRKEIRGTLKNPMAQKLYDSESQGTMSRTMFAGASHAATGLKNYQIQTLESSVTYKKGAPYADPNDPVEFDNRRNDIIDETYKLGVLKTGETDPNSDIHKAAALIATSDQRAQQLVALAYKEPTLAQTMLEEKRHEMTGPDFDKVEKIIRSQSRAIDSANIAQETWYGGQEAADRPAKTLAQMQDEVRKKARALRPDDPILEHHALQQLSQMFTLNKRAMTEEKQINGGLIENAILMTGADSVQKLRADPKIAAAIDAMPDPYKNDLQGRINRIMNAKDAKTKEATDIRIYGMAQRDRVQFLEQDITKLPLHIDRMRYYMNLQEDMRNKPRDNPQVMSAATVIRSHFGAQLRERGIFAYKKDENEDEYDAYIGTLATALELWQLEHQGKRPSDDAIVKDIAPMVLQRRYEPRLFGLLGSRKEEFYNQPASADRPAYDEFVSITKERIKARNGVEPTDADLKKSWTRMQLIKEFEKKKQKPNE